MRRPEPGRYEISVVGGERIKAFLPAPLPPRPALELDGPLAQAIERATLAVGRLDGVSTVLPDIGLFLYTYVRKEAVLSSQIEGTQSSLSDLLLFELDEAPGVPIDDVVEVSNYVAAMDHGIRRLEDGFPLSNRLLREIHEILLSRGRGSGKDPGEFRRSQNWIGGTRPGNALYVPPPHLAVQDCMADLERFLHAEDGLPTLVRAGLAHLQFETIHPFLDGNGRVGRLLITLLLCARGLLRRPLLYLSVYLKEHRQTYYRLLDQVRRDGDWEAWLAFFLDGVRETAESAVATIEALETVFRQDRERIAALGRITGSAVRTHDALRARLVVSITDICRRTGMTHPTAGVALDRLQELGIVRELTGRKRNRVFAYDAYLRILDGVAPTAPESDSGSVTGGRAPSHGDGSSD
jgi:Fic family protein